MNLVKRAREFNRAQILLWADMTSFLEDLKNKSIPLKERWTAFSEVCEVGTFNKIELYGDGYVEVLHPTFTLVDTFYVNRGTTVLYIDLYEHIDDGTLDEYNISEETINEWKEQVLQSGYAGTIAR